jgi:hypothetical protein
MRKYMLRLYAALLWIKTEKNLPSVRYYIPGTELNKNAANLKCFLGIR